MRLIRAIEASPARRLFIDFSYERRLRDREFPKFAAAVRHMGPSIVLAVPSASFEGHTSKAPLWPADRFGPEAVRSFVSCEYVFWQVWKVPLALRADGRLLPRFASLL